MSQYVTWNLEGVQMCVECRAPQRLVFDQPFQLNHPLHHPLQGTGCFFNFEVHDGKIDMKVTAFMEQCAQFFDVVEEGASLIISGGNRNLNFKAIRP